MVKFEELDAVLDEIYDCILNARFADLSQSVVQMDRLLLALPSTFDRVAAEKIRSKSDRNGRCLQAAARGMRAAQRRLGDLSTATTRLATYTVHGQRAEVDIKPVTLAQRL